MSIIGATVGTPISPEKIEEKINPVKTVNGKAPDENGNVEVVGADGISPVISVSAIDGGHRITITDKDGTKNVDVMDGTVRESVSIETSYVDDNITFIKFSDGSLIGIPNGSNEWIINVTPVEDTQGTGKILTFMSGAQVRINDGHTPVKGTDFFTPADKTEMVNDVIAALPNAEGVEF